MSEKNRKAKKAVALKFEPGKDKVPHVKAKGVGQIAETIIRLAEEHNIPVKDDPDLVEVLSKLDIDEAIPSEVYVVVAELLAFVYSANKNMGKLSG